MCNCVNIKAQTYDNATAINKPFGRGNVVSIDNCILGEIKSLWSKGIKTTGCCCGHNYLLPFIGVEQEHYNTMRSLGYHEIKDNQFTPLSLILIKK